MDPRATPSPGNTPGLPNAALFEPRDWPRCVLIALDELSTARNLVELIAMTTRCNPDSDEKAIAAGCEAVLARIDECSEILKGGAA